jgi:predicted transcriptional regulator
MMIFGARVPIFGTGLINGLWLAFIGWFLNNAALISYQQLLVREALEDVPVSRIMQSSVSTIGPEVPVSTLVDEYLMRSDQRAYPVVEGERFVGLVCLEDVRKLARQAWPHTKIREIMTRAADVAAVAADDAAAEAMLVLTRRRVNQLPVVENGKVQGIVRREDILKWLSLYGDPTLASQQA